MPSLARAPSRVTKTMIMDSARWDDLEVRDGDVVVATYPKCGTTWTQRIVDLLIHQSPDPRPIMANAPWIDCMFMAPHEVNKAVLGAQTHRRSMKSHLPFDSLPIYDGVKYIHTARDGRDAALSMHNHQQGLEGAREKIMAQAMANAGANAPAAPMHGGPPPVPDDPREFFLGWMHDAETGAAASDAGLPYCEFEQTYWSQRHRPNLLMVHYSDLKADLAGEMARIGAFLDIETPPAVMERLVEAAGFESMKAQGDAILPGIGQFFDHGPQRFLAKGENGRWKGVLTDADLARYDTLATARLSPALHAWIHNGRLAAGDPRELPD